jgi:aryl-alcohol dehydrogenase-like predicted oxidoreductase
MHLSIQDRPPEARSEQVIHAALDAGITFVDTADVYCLDDGELGHNERLVARALRSWRGGGEGRDGVLVGTKGGMRRPEGRWERDATPAHLRAACERSLRALGVERIDLYQLHAPDPRVPLEESVSALADLRREGKIARIGLSNVSVEEIRRAQGVTEIATVQNRLSPFFREALDEGVVAHCAAKGIGFLAYSPTGGGRLTRKLPDHPVLRPMAERLGATPHQLVIAWALAQAPNVVPIPSARSVEHVRASAAAAALELSPADLDAIKAAEFSRA